MGEITYGRDDSRIRGVSIGAAGMIRPTYLAREELLERAYCLHCGRPGGWVSAAEITSLIYVCSACDRVLGPAPLPRAME